MGEHPRSSGAFMRQEQADAQVGEGDPQPPPASPLPVSVTVRWRGQPVGHVEDGVFVRTVRQSHILRQPPALALHIPVIDLVASMGAVGVAFNMPDGSVLAGPLDLFTGPRAIPVNRGAGDQRAVLLVDFFRLDVRPATGADLAAFAAAVSS